MDENTGVPEINTTVDGVRAIEMRYRPIYETYTKKPVFFQSSVRLNSPDMGVLLPERFMPVLESDDRCVPLFKLALLQTLKAADKFTEREIDFDWISIFMPLRLLRNNDCMKILTEFTDMVKASPAKICFEISPMLVYEDGRCRETLKELRKAGYHTMLAGVGGEIFPLSSLADYEPEYVMLDGEITRMLNMGERSEAYVKSVLSLVNGLEAEPVAAEVSSADTADKLYDMECSYYTEKADTENYAGNFQLERFIRRKNQE